MPARKTNPETLCVVCHNHHHSAGASPIGWTDLEASETVSSLKLLNGSENESSNTRRTGE